ncbi:hypothetical protein [Novosphingobium sp.]|uniref:hypothetical protein n=1 Tax=Novosphingobium sp. TaxID=1874826 RepID=UPI002629458F|nr:hypothetical protein [Novosphingobium sp.]
MSTAISIAHRRFIAMELAIGTVLGAVLPAITMYFTMDPFPMAVSGPDGLLWFMAKNAFGMGTVMTLLMTLGVRLRVRKGTVPALPSSRESHGLLRIVPHSVLARAVLFGLAALAGPGLASIIAASAFAGESVDRLPFTFIMAAASALTALFLIPAILICALTDLAPPASTDLPG